MSFTDVLDRILHDTPGAVAVTLMGFDGIAIESRGVDIYAASGQDISVQATTVELGQITNDLKRVVLNVGVGAIEEVTVQAGGLTTVIRPISETYFIALSLAPDALVGKGRYLMRVSLPELVAELGA